MLIKKDFSDEKSYLSSFVYVVVYLFPFSDIFTMKIAVNSLLSLLDVGTGFCYWLLGRDLLQEEIQRLEQLFIKGIHSFVLMIINE